jgi:hypothetical protein
LATLLVAVAVAWGCSSSDDASFSSGQSRKGEACQVTADCLSGLACQPSSFGAGGVCVVAVFNVSPTAKECVLSQCTVAADCCPPPSSLCSQLLKECGDGGPDFEPCIEYDQLCKCNISKRDCQNNRCITFCGSDAECGSTANAHKCAGGACVECANDTDCANGSPCIDGSCRPPCTGDGDCPGFERCIEQKCIEAGCQTDRECISATRNVEATCGTDGKCILPCQTDLECGNPKDYSFFSCINAQCIYTGCQTDKDCRLLLTGPSDASVLPPNEHVLCRDKTTAGPTSP